MAASETSPRVASPTRERFGVRPALEAAGDTQSFSLRLREVPYQPEKWRAELLKNRVVEFHLALDPCSPNDSEPLAGVCGLLEQCRLADAGVAVNDEHGAMAVACRIQKPLELGTFTPSADQAPLRCGDDHSCSMPLLIGCRTLGFVDLVKLLGCHHPNTDCCALSHLR